MIIVTQLLLLRHNHQWGVVLLGSITAYIFWSNLLYGHVLTLNHISGWSFWARAELEPPNCRPVYNSCPSGTRHNEKVESGVIGSQSFLWRDSQVAFQQKLTKKWKFLSARSSSADVVTDVAQTLLLKQPCMPLGPLISKFWVENVGFNRKIGHMFFTKVLLCSKPNWNRQKTSYDQ